MNAPYRWTACSCESKPLEPGEPMPDPNVEVPHDADCPCAPLPPPPVAPAQMLLSDGIELHARRTGPLTIAESYRNPDVVAQCDLCERIRLKRHLVRAVKLGIVKCHAGCAATSKMEAELRDAKNAAQLDAENLATAANWGRALDRKHERRAKSLAPMPAPSKPEPVLKTCGCCKQTFTHAQWLRLDMLEVKEVTEDGVVELHDMRNCECGSTLLMISEREKGTGIYYREGES